MPRELYRVCVDETGDRGWGGRASPIFVMTAVIARDADVPALKTLRDGICTSLGKPVATVLHWADNVKEHSQRKHVSRQIGGAPLTLTNVIVMKKPLMGSGTALSDATTMYNYALRRLLERITWYVDDRGGEAIITFAHVKRFPYERLQDYLRVLQTSGTEIRWHAIRGKVRIDQPNRVQPLQLADLAAGGLASALRPDRFGDYELSYLRELLPRIYIRGRGAVTSYGMNIVGPPGCMNVYPWWQHFEEACRLRAAA
jgi:hypothetical protein